MALDRAVGEKVALPQQPQRCGGGRSACTTKLCSVFGSWCCFDRRRVMNSADVADAMERTRESIDESRQLMADVPESVVRRITAALESRRPRHCWSASVCRPDSPPNLLIETLRC